MEYLQKSGFQAETGLSVDPAHFYPSLGGETLLTMATRKKAGYPPGELQIDVMMDPIKGQGPHEALIWLNMAKAAGMSVRGTTGEEIDLNQKAFQFFEKGKEDDSDRIKYIVTPIISVNQLIIANLQV